MNSRRFNEVVQFLGVAVALVGVYLLLGVSATLIIGGIALLAVGVLREAKVI